MTDDELRLKFLFLNAEEETMDTPLEGRLWVRYTWPGMLAVIINDKFRRRYTYKYGFNTNPKGENGNLGFGMGQSYPTADELLARVIEELQK